MLGIREIKPMLKSLLMTVKHTLKVVVIFLISDY